MQAHAQRALALVGPGRAGTTLAVGLAARVDGRRRRRPRPRRGIGRGRGEPARCRTADVTDAGRGADLVLVATPDAAIADTAAALAPGLEPGALVVHLSGACTLDELTKLELARPDVRTGALHPLQSLPSAAVGVDRLPGSWCAVDGPDDVERIAVSLGMRPFRVAPEQRTAYHAAACIASNHLVALLGQVARVAAEAGVPADALLPLVRATVENVAALGTADALTGPVARGDVDTVARHLDALPAGEQAAYRALAAAALQLTGCRDPAMADVLTDDGPREDPR